MIRLAVLILLAVPATAMAEECARPAAVCATPAVDALPLIRDGHAIPVMTDPGDDPGVLIAAANLAQDLRRVSGGKASTARHQVIVGTLGRNPIIDRLVAEGRIDRRRIAGKWEAFLQQVVDHPAPGIDRALVIVGSDRRGTIFGSYDLSRRAGVSPWNWWADVPVPHQPNLFVQAGARVEAPAVKYRGIFLNDEDPALSGWAKAKFGGLDHRFYGHVFELVLRLKGDMIWPAMWGKSLWDDDPESAALAERMGIVLGTSHHEPMLRAHVEWQRHGAGAWDYTVNADRLRAFWRAGLVRNAGREALVTVGMRGDGDEPMTQGTAVPLLERIVADQRKIIAEVTGKPAAETPQVWALYKEVQDYYDQGMRVPDDVTLLFSDDNWGNIRRLPGPGDRRAGGYGVYYHFDYVGGPRNYKWINTTQVARVWEQMSLAYARGADRLWIVNVGDLKPMELPTSFFLDFAWNPAAWPRTAIGGYHRAWAAEQFGAKHADEISDILDRTTRYAARRKPELLSPEVWKPREWDRVTADYDRLEADAERVGKALPAAMQDAYFELVLHPVLAAANLNRLYATVARNRRHAAQGLADTNRLADQAEALFARDKAIAARYEASAGGKWPHMMDQTHIGYTGWQQPATDVMPGVKRLAHPSPIAKPPRSDSSVVDSDGQVVIEAAHAAARQPAAGAAWEEVPHLGRTGSAMTVFPQDAPVMAPGKGPSLDYDVVLATAGPIVAQVVAAPSLDVLGGNRLRYAIAIDDEAPQVVNLLADPSDAAWRSSVIANARIGASRHIVSAGRHVVHVWMVDPGVVVERVVLGARAIDPLALDAEESER